MESTENSLTFFTTSHPKHDSQWRMTGGNVSVVCVACLVELLENPDVFHLRKRKALREVVFLVANSPNLLELLSQNAKVVSHLVSVIMDLLSSENELLVNTAIEALDVISVRLRSEIVVEEIMDKVQTQILGLNNLKKTFPFVLTMGRLLKSIPVLPLIIAKDSPHLIEYFVSNILFPEDNIKAAFLFALIQIFSNEDALNTLSLELKERVCNKVCGVVACSITSDVQANALGVFKRLSTQQDVLNALLKPSTKGNCALLESLKKLMLSSNEAIQIGAIQCVTQILRNDLVENPYTKAFLTCGIGEILLEDLESSNDIIISSVFCSLDFMVKVQLFYSEGYSVYGMESVIVGVSKAIKLKNPEILRQGLRVLSIILSMQPSSVLLFPSEGLYKQCASVLLESLKSTDHRVLTQAANAVENFLNIYQHPSSMEFDVIVPLVSATISHLHKFSKARMYFRHVSRGSLETFLCSLLRVIKNTLQFVKDFQAKKPSHAALLSRSIDSMTTEKRTIDDFLESLWKSVDQICVPVMMLNCESVENPDIITNFFHILHLSVSPENAYSDSFARKLSGGCFVRLALQIREKFCRTGENKDVTEATACFLTKLCLACGNETERSQLEDHLKKGSIACITSPSACLNLLAQSSVRKETMEIVDGPLFRMQCCCIELMHVSFAHGDEIVPVEELAVGLHKYLALHPDLSILPRVSLKHLLFLCITCWNKRRILPFPATVIESINVSQRMVEQSLLQFKPEEFDDIYIHGSLFVSWLFSCESLGEKFGRQVFICLMETEKTQKSSDHKALHQVLTSNLQTFGTFLSLVDHSEEPIVSRVVDVLEALISELSASGTDPNSSTKTNKTQLRSMANHSTNIFHKLFVGHKSNPLHNHSIVAMVKILTAVQMNFQAFDIKLLYHVISLLTSANESQRFTIAGINFLNVSLAWELERERQRVAAIILSNKALCDFIQRILDTNQDEQAKEYNRSTDDSNLFASVLLLVSSLAIAPSQFHKEDREPFRVNKRFLVNMADERRNVLGLSSLVFWDAFFRTTAGTSGKPILVLSDSVQDTEQNIELSDVDFQVLHVYLQNSLVHDSESVRQCAVKCMASLLNHVPDASSFARNPWNRIVLQSHLSVLSVNVVTPSLVSFCLLVLRLATKRHQFTDVLSSAVKSILDRIPSIPFSDKDLSWHCVNLLAHLSTSEDNMKIISQNQKGPIASWLVTFKGSLDFRQPQSEDPTQDFKFCVVDGVIFAKEVLKASAVEDRELLAKAFLLLGDQIDGDYEETTAHTS